MENRSDYEKRLGEKLEAAYMLEEIPQGMSREDFHRLIQAAEKKKKRRRNMLSLAAACVALCLVCGGFVAGMTLGESATAGNDGETKIVQQGDSVIIGSGVGENDENVGVSTKTYTSIEDIPEDIRKEIHFLDSDDFELEKVKVAENKDVLDITAYYNGNLGELIFQETEVAPQKQSLQILKENNKAWISGETVIYVRTTEDFSRIYSFIYQEKTFNVIVSKDVNEEKIKAIIDGLID